jgi:hypothetical protein
MEENNNGLNNSNNNNKNPRFGSYWIYGVIALFLIGLNLFSVAMGGVGESKITMSQFDSFVLAGDVEKIEIVNNEEVFVYIKSDRLNSENHTKVNKGGAFSKGNPQYTFTIGRCF